MRGEMLLGRRDVRARREPVVEAPPARAPDLRLDPNDRPGGPPASSGTGKRRPPAARERRRAASDEAEQRPGRGEVASMDKRAGRKGRKGGNNGRGGEGKRRSLVGRLIYWSFVLGLWALLAAIGATVWVASRLPPIQSLEVPKRPPTIEIVGLNGRVLATRGDMGAAVPIKELPAYLPNAFIAVEDRRFYSHHGLDPVGVARALVANVLRRGVSQGGSTLTQQLAKNLFLTQERNLHRKLQELVLAVWLERKYTKAQILELYLNRVYFGAGAYGVEAAAQRYFGKSARRVTLAEAALLAGLVKSPSRLAPTRNPDGAERRAQVVLAAMADTKLISD